MNQFWDMMDKVGDIFTALPFSNSVLEALKLVAAAAMTFLDVEAVHLNFLLSVGPAWWFIWILPNWFSYSPGITATNALAQPFQCIFWWCNLELQVCSKYVILNKS